MQVGRGVDAATVGFEGMVGIPLVLGESLIPYEVTVQVAGEGLRLSADAFLHLLHEDDALRNVLLRYIEVVLIQTTRTAACNQLHRVEERLARWLLHSHDWVWKDRFRLTQDFLAAMLGVRRPSVSLAAGALQEAGLIRYRRGVITIADREGLEAAACEDYAIVRDAFERLLPLPSPITEGDRVLPQERALDHREATT
jgi:CRP-like cAMP-binding protein